MNVDFAVHILTSTAYVHAHVDLLAGLLNSQNKQQGLANTTAVDADGKQAAFLAALAKATSLAAGVNGNGGIGSRAGACIPEDGLALRDMLEDPNSCTIISLRPGIRYNVAKPDSDDDITIRSRKVCYEENESMWYPLISPSLLSLSLLLLLPRLFNASFLGLNITCRS